VGRGALRPLAELKVERRVLRGRASTARSSRSRRPEAAERFATGSSARAGSATGTGSRRASRSARAPPA